MKITKNMVFSSLFWDLLQKFGTTGIQFVLQLILARLLLPEDYGIIAIVNVFIAFASIFVGSGLNTALVQKKDADEIDFSSVFFASLVVAVILYIVLFVSAPIISSFFHITELESVIRVLSITLFFSAFNSIQQAYIQKHMQFKKLFISSIAGISISGVIGIFLAFQNFGIWALVWQQLINKIILTTILLFVIDWQPKLIVSFNRLKDLFSFGWKVFLSSLITTLYVDIRTIVIGRFFSADLLGYYNRGQQFPQLATNNIVSSIQTVMFPTFSSQQDNKEALKSMISRSISVSIYIVAPMMCGLFAIAENLVLVTLTEKWIKAVPFLRLYCISNLFRPIFATNLQSINAVGRSDIFLKMETLKTVLYTIILLISIPFGVYGIAIGSLISSVVSLPIYTKPNEFLLDFGFAKQIQRMKGPLYNSIFMGMIVYALNFLNMNPLATLILQTIVGLVVYLMISVIFKMDSFYYLLDLIKDLIEQKRIARSSELPPVK